MGTPADQKAITARIDGLLDKRPPLPPTPADARWVWTKQKLRAVYLEAFTPLEKKEIAAALEIAVVTFWQWRRAPDYKRYLATLIAADGLADRSQRVKARKTLADSLQKAIADRLAVPGALAGEKLSSLLRAQREMLDALQEDAEDLRQLGESQNGVRDDKRPALDLAEKLAGIQDPAERETVKRHLLRIMGEYLDAPTSVDSAPVDITEAVEGVFARDSATNAPESSPQDLPRLDGPTPTAPSIPEPQAPSADQSAPTISADDFSAD